MTKLAFIDLETTGLSAYKSGIVQIGIILEINNEIKIKNSILIKPFPEDQITPAALKVNGLTLEDFEKPDFLEPSQAFKRLLELLQNYVDPYKKEDKYHFVGYNSQKFDDPFLERFFVKNNDRYYRSWFHVPTLDVMVLAAQFLRNQRTTLKDFKLVSVARACGITVEETKLHDALYDIELTRQIYKTIIGSNDPIA